MPTLFVTLARRCLLPDYISDNYGYNLIYAKDLELMEL